MKANERWRPLNSKTARNLADVGWCSSGEVQVADLFSSGELSLCNLEGCGEGLRRTRNGAAGVKLDPAPVNRWSVNVGTNSALPSLPLIQSGSGQAHRQLLAPRRDIGPVVVRAWESHVHGEGGQQAWSKVWSREGRR